MLNTAVGKFINESNAGEDVQMKDVGNADAETKEKRDDDDGKPEASPTSQTGYVLADKLHRRQDNLELISPVQDGLGKSNNNSCRFDVAIDDEPR